MSSTNGFCWCHRSPTVVLVGQVEVSAVITEQSVSHEAPVVRKTQGMGWDPWHMSRFTSEAF